MAQYLQTMCLKCNVMELRSDKKYWLQANVLQFLRFECEFTLGIKRREIGQVRHSFDSAVVRNSVGKFNMAHLMSGKKNV